LRLVVDSDCLINLGGVLAIIIPGNFQIVRQHADDVFEYLVVGRAELAIEHEAPHGDARVANACVAAANAWRFLHPALVRCRDGDETFLSGDYIKRGAGSENMRCGTLTTTYYDPR
jgi:hypothetical protein